MATTLSAESQRRLTASPEEGTERLPDAPHGEAATVCR
jgi:hypothetical protein